MSVSASWQELLLKPRAGSHIAQAYRDDRFLLDSLCQFVKSGLSSGDGVVVIVTPKHWRACARQLNAVGVMLLDAKLRGQLTVLDAARTLSSFMVNGMPDWKMFQDAVGTVINLGRRNHARMRIFSEMVDLLWQRGERQAASRLEELCNHLVKVQDLSLYCAYRVDALDEDAYDGALQMMCTAHSHFIPARDYAQLEQSVRRATEEVLGVRLAKMLQSLAATQAPQTEMPPAQYTMFWLKQHMPSVAGKVLSRARAHQKRPAATVS